MATPVAASTATTKHPTGAAPTTAAATATDSSKSRVAVQEPDNDHAMKTMPSSTPMLVLLALVVQRVKWIRPGECVVLQGVTTTTSPANDGDKSQTTVVAPANKTCQVMVSSPRKFPNRKERKRRQRQEREKNQSTACQSHDTHKDYKVNQKPTTRTVINDSTTTPEDTSCCLTQLCRAADASHVTALAYSALADRQLFSWNDLDKEKEASLVLTVTCPSTTEHNRRGIRMVECVDFVDMVWRSKQHGDGQTVRTHGRGMPVEAPMVGPVREDAMANVPAQGAFGLYSKTHRHELFADWIVQTYYGGSKIPGATVMLDVAGGDGQLARALIRRGVTSVVLLDPKPRLSSTPQPVDEKIHILALPLVGDASDLLGCSVAGPWIRKCTLIVGMHPDQATEAIVDLSQHCDIPFALLPCCVMPSLFPQRRQQPGGDPVRSYRTFCTYLQQKRDPPYHEAHLPFDGRNKIIYSTRPSFAHWH